MNNKRNRFSLSSLALAVVTSLSATAYAEEASSDEELAIEEVVVKASRLKGTASAVMEERKSQAFVADILGAEQISRTGDTNAASALRRVTGLTLVDGKYIYIRGLGERYSSTQLNGAAVPSPDPTRTVIPLDMFPASIIESLAVQKSYSASLPAHFGGGNVDIRLKSIPSDFFLTMQGKLGSTTNNLDDGMTYNGMDEWSGKDDGLRAAPASLQQLWDTKTPLSDLTQAQNRAITADLNRDYDPASTKVDPDYGFDMTLGNKFEQGKFVFGFLAAGNYRNEWQVKELYEGQDFRGNEDGTFSLVRGFDDVKATEHEVKWSGMFNVGVEYDRDHRIDFNGVILRHTVDEVKDKLGNTNNVLISDGLRVRDSEVSYEEREFVSKQIRGTHNFPKLMNVGIDWKYSDASSNRFAPGNISTRYILADENEDGMFDIMNESSLRNSTTATRYSFQDLDDVVENYGFNISLPLYFGKSELELKAGSDFVEKSREAYARRLDLNTLAFDGLDLSGWQLNQILSDDVILNHPLKGNTPIIRDTTIAGDDYLSAQKIDAYYGEVDWFYDNKWRITAGVRWEDFRQVVAPLDPATGQFDLPKSPTTEDLANQAFQKEDFYPSIATTYIANEEMQYRLSYSETTIRPDIREVAQTTYLDPITTYPVRGTSGILTADIKHIDLRWEWYMQTGENLSVGLFYKDMINPIESVQSPGVDGPPLVVMANADDGYLYGVEVEFLKDIDFLGSWGEDFFLSGNVTLSDSEVNINTQRVVDQADVSAAITNPKRRLTGHSKYVVNMNLGYDAPNGNHSATLAYNVFGERIMIPGIEGQEDRYEQPFHSLDFVYTYYPTYSSTVKFKVKNILDEKKEITFSDTLFRSESKGIGFDVSFKYDF